MHATALASERSEDSCPGMFLTFSLIEEQEELLFLVLYYILKAYELPGDSCFLPSYSRSAGITDLYVYQDDWLFMRSGG